MTLRVGNRTENGQFDGPRALRPEEHLSAINLLNSVLRPNGPPSILKEYPLVIGMDNIENMRVIVKGDEVVSHAAIYFSTVLSENLMFKVGGIGSVATHPDHRGKGLASMVMEDCINVMQETGCHVSVLWTQRHDFYRNLGYETAGSEYLFRFKSADLERFSRRRKIVPYAPRYLQAVMETYDRKGLRTQRTKKEWEAYLGLPKSRKLLALRGDRVTAYAVLGKGKDFKRCILEWGGEPQDILSLMYEFASSIGGEIMILVPAYETKFMRLLEQMGLPRIFEYLAMMRIIDVEGISSLIREYMANQHGADFQILTSDSGFTIRIGKEKAAIPNERALPRILFGPDAASSLLGGLSRETASALDKVLPIPLFIWGLDSV